MRLTSHEGRCPFSTKYWCIPGVIYLCNGFFMESSYDTLQTLFAAGQLCGIDLMKTLHGRVARATLNSIQTKAYTLIVNVGTVVLGK